MFCSIEQYLVFDDDACNKLLKLSNPFVGPTSPIFQAPLPDLVRSVKTHDMFKLGSALWSVDTSETEASGVAAEE